MKYSGVFIVPYSRLFRNYLRALAFAFGVLASVLPASGFAQTEFTAVIQSMQLSGDTNGTHGAVYIFEDPYNPITVPWVGLNTQLERAVFANLISAMATQRPVTFKGAMTCDGQQLCVFAADEVVF